MESLSLTVDDDELDATVLFKQEASELTSVKDLAGALSKFGFSPDDKISRRELVTIYNQIRNAMEPEIFRLANSGCYSEAKEMRARLTNLRAEFDNLQLSGAANIRNDQQTLFMRASQEVLKNTSRKHSEELGQQEQVFRQLNDRHELFHEIERTHLDEQISLIPTPNMRYSKRLIELFKSEYSLNKLKQYDEAIKVRRMIDKLLPLEEKKFYGKFNQSIEKMRTRLNNNQKEDDRRFEEKIKSVEWTNYRRREQEMKM
eukprot:scaffold5551_cov159-Ochromonas_danica.AAC.8